jgi:hypothetical protein
MFFAIRIAPNLVANPDKISQHYYRRNSHPKSWLNLPNLSLLKRVKPTNTSNTAQQMKKILIKTGSFIVSEKRSCPACSSPYLDRIPRRLIDRLVSLFVRIKRYHCSVCQWEGNIKIGV